MLPVLDLDLPSLQPQLELMAVELLRPGSVAQCGSRPWAGLFDQSGRAIIALETKLYIIYIYS